MSIATTGAAPAWRKLAGKGLNALKERRAWLWLAGGRVGAAGVGFFAVSALAHTLDPVELGVWSLIVAVQGYLLHASELGLRSAVTAEAGAAPGEIPRLLRPYLTLRLGACLAVVPLAVGAAALAYPHAATAFAIALISLPMIALQLDWVALTLGRGAAAGALLLVRPAAYFGLLLLLPGTDGLVGVAVAFAGSWALAAAASWPCLRIEPDASAAKPRERSKITNEPESDGSPGERESFARPRTERRRAAQRAGARHLLRRGLPMMGVTLLNQGQANLDLMLAGLILGAAAAGELYLTLAVFTAALLPANSLGQLALARLAAKRERPDDLAAELARDTVLLAWLTSLGAAALILVSPWFVPIAFGPEHHATAGLIVALAPWLVLQSATTLSQSALNAVGLGPAVLRANVAALAVALPSAALVLAYAPLEALVLARVAGEAARLACLAKAGKAYGVAPALRQALPLPFAFAALLSMAALLV